MSDDSDYVPDYEEEAAAEEDIVDTYPEVEREDSGYLTGATTATDDDGSDIFDEEVDPFSLLQSMQTVIGTEEAEQPYEVLRSKRARNRKPKDGEADSLFGADVEDIWNDAEAQEQAVIKLNKRSRRKRRRRSRPSAKDLPEEVSKKLGDANMLYTTGRFREAADLLLEVVREAPNLQDPYHTLGLIHEALNEQRKALDFYMIAAHLQPKDVGLWRRLAAMSTEAGFYRQAIYCLSKVVHRAKEDLDAQWDRAVLYAEIGETRRALEKFELISQARPGDPEVPKMLARLHHRMAQPDKAIELLERYLTEHAEQSDLTHINILAELYMEQGLYEQTFKLIERAEQVICGPESSGLPIDLNVKAGICLAAMGEDDRAASFFKGLLAEGASLEYGDLLQQVAELQIMRGRYAQAVPMLQRLLENPDFDGMDTWQQLAVSYKRSGEVQEAVSLLSDKVMCLEPQAPRYFEGVLLYVEMLTAAGEAQRAGQVLDQLQELLEQQQVGLPEDSKQQMALFLRQNQLALDLGRRETFMANVLPLISDSINRLQQDADVMADPAMPKNIHRAIQRRRRHAKHGRAGAGAEERDSVFKGYKTRDRRKQHVVEADEAAEAYLSEAGGETGEVDFISGNALCETLFVDDAHFNIFMELVSGLTDDGKIAEGRQLVAKAVAACEKRSRWFDKGKRDTLKLLLVQLQCSSGDSRSALQHVKYVCNRWPYSWAVWNHYCQIYNHTGSVKQWIKFVISQRSRNIGSLPLIMLQGHVLSANRSYKQALQEYLLAYQFLAGEPLLLLCLGVTYINMAMGKKVLDRNRAVLLSFAFLQEYERRRGNKQESSYNIARALHQLGLLHMAVPFYERSLGEGATAAGPAVDGVAQRDLDMRHAAAHNLALIYRQSGADDMARQVLAQHLVV